MSPTPTRCVFMGQESLLIQCAEIWLQRGQQICALVSDEPAIVGFAEQHELSCLSPSEDLVAALSGQTFEYFFSVANLRMVAEAVLALPSELAINFHDGPLPQCAGRNVTTWALLGGAERHAVTWHVMTRAADEGDVLLAREFDVAREDTALTLNTRCYEAGIESFGELVEGLLSGRLERRPQDLRDRVYFGPHQRPAAACSLSFEVPEEAHALVRALDFGSYANPVGSAKLIGGSERREALLVGRVEVLAEASSEPAGCLLAAEADGLRVATSSRDLRLSSLRTLDGVSIGPEAWTHRVGLRAGAPLGSPNAEQREALSRLADEMAPHEPFWLRRLGRLQPVALPVVANRPNPAASPAAPRSDASAEGGGRVCRALSLRLPGHGEHAHARHLAAFASLLARLGEADAAAPGRARVFHVLYRDPELARRLALSGGCDSLFAPRVPMRLEVDPRAPFAGLEVRVGEELERLRRRGSYLVDAVVRTPGLRAGSGGVAPLPISIEIAEDPAAATLPPASDFALVLAAESGEARCLWDADAIDGAAVEDLSRRLLRLLEAAAQDQAAPVGRLPLLSDRERRRLLVEWNDTARSYDTTACVHTLFEAQAARTPDAVAVIAGQQSIGFDALNRRANRLAHRLRGLGVGPDVLVGVCLERTIDLVTAILAIQKAGGAYLPLDPDFPAERLAFMVEDAGAPVLISQQSLQGRVPSSGAHCLELDAEAATLESQPDDNIGVEESGVRSDHLAYVIYTSGSTGRPKGVQVEHRNVVNFFAGMDAVLSPGAPAAPDAAQPGTWLAVTSLSFDISVLELCWTLARGFRLVLYAGNAAAAPVARAGSDRPISFSLNYFASDASHEGNSQDRYRLLLEGARYADQHGFEAVWMPERHFHAFGGLYPNPSVTAAALATITQRVALRAGSCVLPLHDPIRVAEEWAVVDNLSNGRVGLAFAAGWQPNDFVLQPDHFADAKARMFREIETVRQLWAGQEIERQGPRGPVRLRTLPQPVQRDLPVWITTAGNAETFRMAAEKGAHVLTHLLGQSVDQLAAKLDLYRQTWSDCGHAGEGRVTLLLHTFVGDSDAEVRDAVREPMKRYLASAMSLVKDAAFEFPTFQKVTAQTGKSLDDIFDEGLADSELSALLDFAFERYYETSGLFGTPDACAARVEQLRGIGVDEIACLIDFGVEPDRVLAHLEPLNRVRQDSLRSHASDADSIADLLERHRVTHMQCTPSMAGMLLADPEARAALEPLDTLLLGGEALPLALARDIGTLTSARVINMYGPTETTIWSSTAPVRPSDEAVSIGRPIANTQLYVVDDLLEPVPVGTPGELLIGGDGVVRGYLGRPDLNAERFIANPFSADGEPASRLYRTGDRVRYRPDGSLDFLGRADYQVKLRGYRIELGEIETKLASCPAVREAVVIAREDHPGDKRLVAYYLTSEGHDPDDASLRAHLAGELPDYMVPAHFVRLERLPLTPNAKVDRKGLPAPSALRAKRPHRDEVAPPENELQRKLAEIWRDLLRVEDVGLDDNFFDLGGHSLLAVQVHRRIREEFEQPLSMTDLFRLPTLRALSQHLARGGDEADGGVAEKSEGRAAARRAGLARRRRHRSD